MRRRGGLRIDVLLAADGNRHVCGLFARRVWAETTRGRDWRFSRTHPGEPEGTQEEGTRATVGINMLSEGQAGEVGQPAPWVASARRHEWTSLG